MPSLELLGAHRKRAIDALQRGDHQTAFDHADQLCRAQALPAPRDLILRALAHERKGLHVAAEADYSGAIHAGWGDLLVLRSIGLFHHDATMRREACLALVQSPRASSSDIDFAMARLAAMGDHSVVRFQLNGSQLVGWVAFSDPPMIEIEQLETSRLITRVLPYAVARGDRIPQQWYYAYVEKPCAPYEPVHLTIRHQNSASQQLILYSTEEPNTRSEANPDDNSLNSKSVTVVLPIYGDAESLERCLASLAVQTSAATLQFYIINDASPDDEVAALGKSFCAGRNATYIEHVVNGGFAAAVNTALSHIPQGDILILNSDVIVPTELVDRLASVAHRDKRIGMVSPLSNDAGLASFPAPFRHNPALEYRTATQIDHAAETANGNTFIGAIANLGSCVYLKRSCLSKVGGMSAAFGRGYYEDVDLSLRAEEAGFRNVVATGVYVSHASGRSFGASKLGLISHNRAVIESRFPDLPLREAAYLRADPLSAARSDIEETLTPSSSRIVVVLIAKHKNSTTGLLRRDAAVKEGRFVLAALWSNHTAGITVEMRGPDYSGPQSLSFRSDRSSLERLHLYLSRLEIARLEVVDPASMPVELLSLVEQGNWPLIYVADGAKSSRYASTRQNPSAPQPVTEPEKCAQRHGCNSEPAQGRLDQIGHTVESWIAIDRMSAAVLGQPVAIGGLPRPHVVSTSLARKGSVTRLGVLLPAILPRAELFVLKLARHLRQRNEIKLIILGESINHQQLISPGTVLVSGTISLSDYASTVRSYAVDALFLPYRDELFWLLDGLSQDLGLKMAYFDWSSGLLMHEPYNLALDEHISDEEAFEYISTWCLGHTSSVGHA